MREKIIIGTRGSALAMVQTRWVADTLRAAHSDLDLEIEIIKSTGDAINEKPLASIGGEGLFTKELETAMLEGRVDMAVHSMKDLPVDLPEGLALACVPPREAPNDALIVTERQAAVQKLPRGTVVGTGSVRRKAQLLAVRPDLQIMDIRGNVDTRLRKLKEGPYQAIVLARAGLNRLGLGVLLTHADIPLDIMLPAPGQGALALETRTDDTELRECLAVLNDADAVITSGVERRLLANLGGGCHVPLGTHAQCENGKITLYAVVCSPDGTKTIKESATDARDEWQAIADRLTEKLKTAGADEILKEFEQ
ncbi:MAG: hydroxymethylbilane synthase [Planctomycetes bacterium]|nr:hydroxymethylbilane synthase [Planctomycetota bacterium]